MKIQKVTIAGAGVMGSQISWQIAFSGYDVVVYDAFESGLEKGKEIHKQFAQRFVDEKRGTKLAVEGSLNRIIYTTDMQSVFGNTDLVSEITTESSSNQKGLLDHGLFGHTERGYSNIQYIIICT